MPAPNYPSMDLRPGAASNDAESVKVVAPPAPKPTSRVQAVLQRFGWLTGGSNAGEITALSRYAEMVRTAAKGGKIDQTAFEQARIAAGKTVEEAAAAIAGVEEKLEWKKEYAQLAERRKLHSKALDELGAAVEKFKAAEAQFIKEKARLTGAAGAAAAAVQRAHEAGVKLRASSPRLEELHAKRNQLGTLTDRMKMLRAAIQTVDAEHKAADEAIRANKNAPNDSEHIALREKELHGEKNGMKQRKAQHQAELKRLERDAEALAAEVEKLDAEMVEV